MEKITYAQIAQYLAPPVSVLHRDVLGQSPGLLMLPYLHLLLLPGYREGLIIKGIEFLPQTQIF